ncbi:MAG: formylglycine-generating enzyme family protein, partial [Saprospiraceae bacterium]
ISFLLLLTFSLMSFYPPEKAPVFTLKKFEKKMARVKPGLYACKYEATNLEYNAFLAAVAKTGNEELLEKARIKNENWGREGYIQVVAENYHTHEAYSAYPVVNVSHEGAMLFCEWLTEQYNSYPKRKYKKVKFRLPAEEEWTLAAKAGHENAVFPWGGYSLRNEKGQYMANFRRVPQSFQKGFDENGSIEVSHEPMKPMKLYNPVDAVHLLSPVSSFPPNDFGIHNISGNVAEMLAEHGSTKGGSWRSFGYYLRIDADDENAGFTEPAPTIGFRYFMEVIEE